MGEIYRFGGHELRPSQRTLLAQGAVAALGARAFDLLVFLVESRDRVVPKDEVLERVWPGLVVEENNLSVQISALRRILGRAAIATVPGRGYRFTLPVDVIAGETAADLRAAHGLSSAPHATLPSIAVLPFRELGGESQAGFFGDGMADEIITALAHVPNLCVIARGSSFACRDTSDVRAIGRLLGVRYVLEGSVRTGGRRIRVTAQLSDASEASQLWAEHYDRELSDLFAVQDEVAQRIAGSLQPQLLQVEARLAGRKRQEDLDAWGHVVQAKVKLLAYRPWDLDAAEPHLRRAIGIDPDYAEAHSLLGHVLAWRSYNRLCADWLETAREAVRHSERALALAPLDSAVLTDIGFTYWFLGRFVKSVPVLERAAQINPSAAMTRALLGNALAIVGRSDEALEHLEYAFRLSPLDPLQFMFHCMRASAEFYAGHYEAARAAADLALSSSPDFVVALLVRSASDVRLGRIDEARAALERIDRLGSQWAVDNLFRPRTDGTLWAEYTSAIREAMAHAPRL